MVILKRGDCEHCHRNYRYSLWHSGFGDNSYAYCDQCGLLALINYLNPQVAGFPPLKTQYAQIEESWEPFLKPCPCGGHFRKNQSPRCPFCYEKLSPTHAAEHIEAQARGAGKDWRWQNDWTSVYCIAIDDPNNPGSLLQLIDPVIGPEIEKAKSKSRWSLLFSFGR